MKQWGLLKTGNINIRTQSFFVAGMYCKKHYGIDEIDPVDLLNEYGIYYLGLDVEKAPKTDGKKVALIVSLVRYVG